MAWDEVWKALILFVAGSGTAIVSSLVQSRASRRTAASAHLLEMRIAALNRIWRELTITQCIFAEKVSPGHPRWLTERSTEATTALNTFRSAIDESQIVLDCTVTKALRDLDRFFYLTLQEVDQRPSEFAEKSKELTTAVKRAVESTINMDTQTIRIHVDE